MGLNGLQAPWRGAPTVRLRLIGAAGTAPSRTAEGGATERAMCVAATAG